MQVLKDEIRNSILQKAQELFLEIGFKKTSMKDIALKVGVAVGNLYRYFPHKESLFEAVTQPAYNKLLELITANEQGPQEGLTLIEQVGQVLAGLVAEHREGLLILLYGSTGTSHEQVKEQFFGDFANHICSHLADYNTSHPAEPLQMEVAMPLSVAFLEGYFEIIRLYSDRNQITGITQQYVAVWFMGLGNLV